MRLFPRQSGRKSPFVCISKRKIKLEETGRGLGLCFVLLIFPLFVNSANTFLMALGWYLTVFKFSSVVDLCVSKFNFRIPFEENQSNYRCLSSYSSLTDTFSPDQSQ